ncbi:hypothetical protein O7632_10340 [Solwaraspora sp. WMMD406]|uniref:hypothetical protein n=1 Tax=Solwaraspora sp. WMMD406 TaxID=3016095 RepID=UPI0024173977|nr:hypothetical protein [Solwaraspora sp. WMMD406]MDG4764500.1 hypothetical protein [Solwaraspora sp. WMMD406]
MPKPSSTAPGNRPQPVPVGLLLPPTHVRRTSGRHVPGGWHGLPLNQLAYLIRRYTNVDDVVLDLDAYPAAIAATAYLRRVPARLSTGRPGPAVRLLTSAAERGVHQAARQPGGVDLILASLPEGAQPFTRDSAATAMTTWRPLLRPGGFLVVGLTPPRQPQPGELSRRATVIAAARAAGLFYHQNIPAVLVPLPEHEPRTAPAHPDGAGDRRVLLAGRHLPIVRDLVVFGTTATGEENAHV